MKKSIFLLLMLGTTWVHAATTLSNQGCQYQGDVANQQAHGKGALTCPDGRIYTGEFQHGAFHGKGQFISPNVPNVFLPPFGMRSGKLKGFVLVGQFNKGVATGTFKVYQNGHHLFNMDFEQGMVKAVTAAQ